MIGSPKDIALWLYTQDQDKQFEIKEHKQKRSINANNYAWVLLHQIAEKINSTKEEVYKKYIKEIGIFRPITINNEAVSTINHSWENQGLGWFVEVVTRGNTTTDLLLYYGTSSYNTSQMAKFVDYIVEDCKELGIETMTPEELERLKQEWK